MSRIEASYLPTYLLSYSTGTLSESTPSIKCADNYGLQYYVCTYLPLQLTPSIYLSSLRMYF